MIADDRWSKSAWVVAILCVCLLLLPLSAQRLWGDAGVLIPISEKEEPDPNMLSLERMEVDARIDNQYARTRCIQIFNSHVEKVLEGKYVFDLPAEALISDFAVWDGVIRIPGVILERRRARDVYRVLRQQAIDPGLLQQAESADPSLSTQFSARIVPIPGWGTKRLEMEYTQWLPVENLRSRYVLPLKPALYKSQSAASFALRLSLESTIPISDFRFTSQQYAPTIRQQDQHTLQATLELSKVDFREDFSFEYAVSPAAPSISLLTHPPEPPAPYFASIYEPLPAPHPEDAFGYFLSSVLLNDSAATQTSTRSESRQIVMLIDTSLSMQWEKLEKTYQAISYLLTRLSDRDRFNLVLFNRSVRAFRNTLVTASPTTVEEALNFVKAGYLEDGSDIAGALKKGMELLRAGNNRLPFLILVSDGNPTLGTLSSKSILDEISQAGAGSTTFPIRLCTFGVGSDANRTLLSELAARHGGFFTWAREAEDIDFALQSFTSKLSATPVKNLALGMSPSGAYSMVYAVDPGVPYQGSVRQWIGRYSPALASLEATVSADLGGHSQTWRSAEKPAASSSHSFLPRAWAKARVDALLRLIELEGENAAYIEEVIRLSKRYHFVTPYTSFLAAPRALLRPRLIQPGDPVLRIRTDEDIESVTVLFPFGLVKPMTYLVTEKIWQTRFLAPASMSDGRYACRLILRDKEGRSYQEQKSFIIDSQPPRIQASLPQRAKTGQVLEISVLADSDTRTLHARFAGLTSAALKWSPEHQSNRGQIAIPEDCRPGYYDIQITAEDFAHNVSTLTHRIQIVR